MAHLAVMRQRTWTGQSGGQCPPYLYLSRNWLYVIASNARLLNLRSRKYKSANPADIAALSVQ
jgi:hypothetical protein